MTSVPPPFRHPGPPPLRPELPEGAPEPPEPPASEEATEWAPRLGVPPWAPFAALFAALIVIGVIVEIVRVAVEAAQDGPFDVQGSDAATIGLTVVQGILLVGFAIGTVRIFSGRLPSPAALGLRLTRPWPALGWALLVLVGQFVASALIVLALGEPDEQDLVTDLKAEDSVAMVAAFAILVCVIAPLVEEVFFRGFMFRALAERMPLAPAMVIGGAGFGIVHLPGGDPLAALVLSVLGTMLCFLYWRTRSLLPCILFHATFNSLSFGATKELPWWGFLLLIAASVTATLAISLLVMRRGRGGSPAPAS